MRPSVHIETKALKKRAVRFALRKEQTPTADHHPSWGIVAFLGHY